MNPYYYLFYKLTLFLNKKGNNEWGPIHAMSFFVLCNIIIFYTKIFPATEESKDFHKIIIGTIVICLFITNSILFLNKKRAERIMARYQNESETSRKIGNFLVILYMVVSLGLIVFW